MLGGEAMRYYAMESIGKVELLTLPKNTEIIATAKQSQFDEVDYDAQRELISDRLKQLMVIYLPKYEFTPVVIINNEKEEQTEYWKFKPSLLEEYQAQYRNDGIVSHISFPDEHIPPAFTVRSPKRIDTIAVEMAIAESALRRNILGLKFTKIL